jgi:membrane protein YdbS with pleckstrin-like domain
VDNPSEVDDSVRARAVTVRGLLRQLRADIVLIVPAPLMGLVWAYLDGGGVWSWLGASVITAALALWLGALRGSDPS